jgi:hypothetical protein
MAADSAETADIPDATLLPLGQAARALKLTERQVRLRIASGAPVAVRGAGGRGRTTIISIAAWRAWEADQDLEQRRRTELQTARRDAFIEASAIVREVLAELRRQNAFESFFGIKPWRQEKLEGFLWMMLATEIRKHAEANGGGSLTRKRQV